MKLNDLTVEDWDRLQKFTGWSNKKDWLRRNISPTNKILMENAFRVPFSQIPILMSTGLLSELAVYKFRLEKGV